MVDVMEWYPPRAILANDALFSILAADSKKLDRASPYVAPDGYQARSHPDLSERLIDLARGLDYVSTMGYGRFMLAHPNGALFAVVSSNWGLSVRLTFSQIDLPDGEAAPSPIGEARTMIRAWLGEIPPDVATHRLRSIVAESYRQAASEPPASASG